MSLEKQLSDLTAAVKELTAAIRGGADERRVSDAPVQASAPPAPVAVAPAPAVSQAPAPAAPAMPAPPTFAVPQAAPVAPAAVAPSPGNGAIPFNDKVSLVNYVTGLYKALGPQKGLEIGTKMRELGVANIGECKPEQYEALYHALEGLRA